jgi:hypothetical protein
LERIGKLSLMLDYRLDHGKFPDITHLKHEIGHDIVLIYDKSTHGSFRTGMFEAVAPLRQLYVLHVIRYFTELLLSLHDLMRSDEDLPSFSEVFALFYNSDRYMRTRKAWEKV